MKSKTFIILSAVVLVLGGIAYFLFQEGAGTERDGRIGARLFAELPAEKIDMLKITSREGTVTVSIKADQWVVAERSDFPADFSKISSIVERISNLKVGRDLDASELNLGKLALHAPDKEGVPDETLGVRIEIAGGGKTIVDLLVGRERTAVSGSGGHYVLPAGSKTIHLVDQDLKYLDKKPEDWIRTGITDIDGMDVRQVMCRDGGPEGKTIYTITRPEKGQPPQLITPVSERQINPSKVDQLFDGLSSFEMVDVARSPQENGPAVEKRIEYHLYDGRIYTVQLVGPVEGYDDRYAIHVNVAYTDDPTAKTVEVSGTDEIPTQGAAGSVPEQIGMDPAGVKRENDDFGQWEFQVSQWSYNGFNTVLDDLLEKDEAKE
jgi:hypothetical protein